MNIGLLGVDHLSENLGCQALTYTLMSLINEALKQKNEVAVVNLYVQKNIILSSKLPIEYSNLVVCVQSFQFSKLNKFMQLLKQLKKEDIVFDITGGDSFSDIYGMKRFLTWSFLKGYINLSKTSLILAPQTYGPYTHNIAKKMASVIVKNADYVFARDKVSNEFVVAQRKKEAFLAADVAFALPYTKTKEVFPTRKRIGLNVSGLLYNGGYTGNNQFSLRLNYVEYIERLIESFQQKKYEVVLVPHVICRNRYSPEDDVTACEKLMKRYPQITIAPRFGNPMEAKDFISQLDIFIGSRMHATIAAFSSGVVTIPVSYSVKFNRLFAGLEYAYLIDAKELTTQEALDETLNYVRNSELLLKAVLRSEVIWRENLKVFTDMLNVIIQKQLNTENIK